MIILRMNIHLIQTPSRTKFVAWLKKFEKMDNLVVEFEVAVEQDKKLQLFLNEVQLKYNSMLAFKKEFQKFTVATASTIAGKAILLYCCF